MPSFVAGRIALLAAGRESMAAISAGFAWWIGELKALVPDRFRARLGWDDRLVFEPFGEELRVWLQVPGRRRLIASGSTAGAVKFTSDAQTVFDRFQHRAVLSLPAREILTLSPEFPLSAAGDIAKLVENDLDRQIGLDKDSVYFGYRIAARDRARKRIKLALSIAHRGRVDQAIELARRFGLIAVRAQIQDSSEGLPNLLPWTRVQPVGHRNKPKLRLIDAALGLAFIALLFLWSGRQSELAATLTEKIEQTRGDAQAVEAVQKSIALSQSRLALIGERRHAPQAVSVIADLTSRLPDNVWLYNFKIEHDALQISGFAPQAAEVLKLLATDRMILEPQFRTAITQSPSGNGERFTIGAKVPQ